MAELAGANWVAVNSTQQVRHAIPSSENAPFSKLGSQGLHTYCCVSTFPYTMWYLLNKGY